ncbi:hypothetical protein EDEG_00078 [Edhazardia aedis USNM 41457]|uniref:fructose-bisphosphate aldolase n=1 Tax=Edhazardia aedis (strain USNM 41457) TaxID=1003232 RepID=J9DB17_EDHAE|nr:hypothetical protein EDEG_00078 [Edhazardia aedis USNM 41457]|eukprot:EJW04961.1 hypothetical protein EDEG_00078 [Edhazardia aedis USNM 41457]
MKNDKIDFTKLEENARKIFENGKGILAADESPSSLEKKFNKFEIKFNEYNRYKFREILMSVDNLNTYIGGMILHEEIFRGQMENGKSFVDELIKKGIAPGIKLDLGLEPFPNDQKITKGLDSLEHRLSTGEFSKAVFAKWRTVFSISKATPTEDCINTNNKILAQYAKICQRNCIVPIVEPEILFDGEHSIEECKLVMKTVLSNLLYHLNDISIHIPGLIIKPSFVTAGKSSNYPINVQEVSLKTFGCLIDTIPPAVAGIAFLSGGHTSENSIKFLNALNNEKGKRTWCLSFSFGRALTDVVLQNWKGKESNIPCSKDAFKKKLNEVWLAGQGQYFAN